MDEKYVEQAGDLSISMIEEGIAKARLKQIRPTDFEGFCNCGAEVPVERIDGGYFNCIHCQSAFERRGKFFAGGR